LFTVITAAASKPIMTAASIAAAPRVCVCRK
jgi:hypothetical protein